jgi:hypothetical protein
MPSSTQASGQVGHAGGTGCDSTRSRISSRQREQKVSLFLAELPLWVAAILLVVLPTIAAMCGPVLMRRRIGLERLASNNDIAGFKFATRRRSTVSARVATISLNAASSEGIPYAFMTAAAISADVSGPDAVRRASCVSLDSSL